MLGEQPRDATAQACQGQRSKHQAQPGEQVEGEPLQAHQCLSLDGLQGFWCHGLRS